MPLRETSTHLQHLMPASHAGQRIARVVLTAMLIAIVASATVSLTVETLLLP